MARIEHKTNSWLYISWRISSVSSLLSFFPQLSNTRILFNLFYTAFSTCLSIFKVLSTNIPQVCLTWDSIFKLHHLVHILSLHLFHQHLSHHTPNCTLISQHCLCPLRCAIVCLIDYIFISFVSLGKIRKKLDIFINVHRKWQWCQWQSLANFKWQ